MLTAGIPKKNNGIPNLVKKAKYNGPMIPKNFGANLLKAIKERSNRIAKKQVA
jgi:hypothetical protein